MAWRDVVRNVAPMLGRVLAGPAGDAALSAVSNALLGKPDGSDSELETRVANMTPADELALKGAEQAFVASMVDKAVALEQVAAGDRANARAREVSRKDWVPAVLAIAICSAFFILLFVMVDRAIPDANRTAFDILLGMLGTGVTAVLSYYFGSSSSSDTKTAILGRVAESKR